MATFHVHIFIFREFRPKTLRIAKFANLLDFSEIYVIYAGLSLLYRCFKFRAFPSINEGFIGKKSGRGKFPLNVGAPSAETTGRI